MAPIPHIKVKKPVTSVSVKTDTNDYDALLRKIRRQRQELKDYADAIGLTDEEKDARLTNLGALKTADIEGLDEINEKLASLEHGVNSLESDINSIDRRVKDLEKPTAIDPNQ